MKAQTNTGNPPEALWTITELARHMNCCEKTAKKLVRQGLIPKLALTSRTVRFDPTEVKKALSKLAVGR